MYSGDIISHIEMYLTDLAMFTVFENRPGFYSNKQVETSSSDTNNNMVDLQNESCRVSF